ncbi:hypothetical protein NEUTE1DRAFT_50171 [Neurospora tetrasperma FGSC 2508]|uniref:Uncharacterized protein n=1 Tax=Neurospora tetrasperma (strain FGSC 2508 / ATCC MYA-4615 / P0657) TaxID=510951 RepID=F8MVI3_NEUT8|nr:uncharacterized protein NEUTE1DRAFT_50171 [Neurospora tetrasperma FGSC 2508]EGO53935.1 hypothetical protein NEUTE1DRAFT_50171 [Neurospora tetrasperma FGSC 2508]
MKENADKRNPYYLSIDYWIEIKKGPNNKEFSLLFGLLYSIIYKEFLILKKILKDLLDKGFIRANSSEAGILVLFIRKLEGSFHFYCNY